MTARDPHEPGRVATPLELLFDLIFVVAIASNAAQLHHGAASGHWETIVGYTMGWFAIWWAWVNYTWFASAYDNQDLGFRLLSFVIMAGALGLAAGVPQVFEHGQSVAVVGGYAVMRLGLVGLWLRAAAGDPGRRRTALLYAAGVTFVQVLWIARLWVPDNWLILTFFACVALELLVPAIAETRGGRTPFHPWHLADRYGAMTIIVLGEVILSAVQAVQGAMAGGDGGEGGLTWSMAPLIVGGLLIVFALWWFYFKAEHVELIQGQRTVWVFGYGHLPVFASVAAVGAGLASAVDVVQGEAQVGVRPVALLLAIAIAVYAVSLAGLHVVSDGAWRGGVPAVVVAVLLLSVPFAGWSMGVSVLAMGLILAVAVAHHVWSTNRPAAQPGQPAAQPAA